MSLNKLDTDYRPVHYFHTEFYLSKMMLENVCNLLYTVSQMTETGVRRIEGERKLPKRAERQQVKLEFIR